MVRAPGARGGCQRRSCWPRRTGCRFPRRGNAYLLHSFPHSTPPLLRRRKCGRETNSSSRSVCFFFFFFLKESTTFTAHREGAWREFERPSAFRAASLPGRARRRLETAQPGRPRGCGPCDLLGGLAAQFLKSRGGDREGGRERARKRRPPPGSGPALRPAPSPPEPPAAPLRN